MALIATTLPRRFSFASMTINDPDPTLSPIQVRDLLSGAYPEITSAEIGEPVVKNGALVYALTRPVGTKG